MPGQAGWLHPPSNTTSLGQTHTLLTHTHTQTRTHRERTPPPLVIVPNPTQPSILLSLFYPLPLFVLVSAWHCGIVPFSSKRLGIRPPRRIRRTDAGQREHVGVVRMAAGHFIFFWFSLGRCSPGCQQGPVGRCSRGLSGLGKLLPSFIAQCITTLVQESATRPWALTLSPFFSAWHSGTRTFYDAKEEGEELKKIEGNMQCDAMLEAAHHSRRISPPTSHLPPTSWCRNPNRVTIHESRPPPSCQQPTILLP